MAAFDVDANGGGFYPQPRYAAFERAPGISYKVYAEEEVAAALTQPDVLYSPSFSALVAEPHYEFKLVARSHPVYEAISALGDDDDDNIVVIAWYRRPLAFVRALQAFPFADGDPIVLFARDTNTPAFVATLLDYRERAVGAATGFARLDLHEVNDGGAGVFEDVRRVL